MLEAPSPSLLHGSALESSVSGREHERFLLYVPRNLRAGGSMLVTVHGIARRPELYLSSFAPVAERRGTALLVPIFSASVFRGYQRLGTPGGRRADRALLRMVEEARGLIAEPGSRCLLFGFSGGAQFAHRFALARPDAVERLALCAAGCYTFPDRRIRYPLGLRGPRTGRRVRLDLDGLLQIPTTVLVGELDVERDEALRRGRLVDRFQGRDRVERARRFVLAINLCARARGLPAPCGLELLPGCDHSFESCVLRGGLVERVERALFPPRS